jgi:hypothetical protein
MISGKERLSKLLQESVEKNGKSSNTSLYNTVSNSTLEMTFNLGSEFSKS